MVITGAGLTIAANGTEHGDTSEAWKNTNHPDGIWFAAGTYLDTAFISDASIDIAKIGNLTVDVLEATGGITTGNIDTVTLDAGQITSGTISANQIDIDDKIEFSSSSSGIIFNKTSLADTTAGMYYGRSVDENGSNIAGFYISSSTSGIYADTTGTLALNNVKFFTGSAGAKTEFTTVGTHTANISQLTTALAIEIIGGGAGSCTNGVPSEQSGSGVGGSAGTASWLKFYDDIDGTGTLLATHTADGGAATAHSVASNTVDSDGADGKSSSKANSAGAGGTEYSAVSTPTGDNLPSAGTYGGGGGGGGANGYNGSRIAAVNVSAEHGVTISIQVTVPSGAKSVKVYIGAGGDGGVPGGGATITYSNGVPIYGTYSGGYKICCGAPGGSGYVSIADPNSGGVEIDLVDMRDRIIALEAG